MKIRVTPPDSALENAFSLIADFEGDMNNILHTPFDPVLPALALRNMMLFPGVVGSVTIGREYSLRVVKQAVKKNSIIALFSQRDEQVEMPAAADLYPQGVAARIMRTIDLPSGHMAAIIQCYGPLQLKSLRKTSGGFRAEVEPLEEQLCAPDDTEFLTVTDACRTSVLKYLKYNEQVGGEKAAMAVRNISHPVFFINFLCSNLPISPDERYGLFEKHEMMARAYDLLRLLNRECQYAQIKADIEARTREDLDQQQRDYFMQQQIRKMQDELGEGEDTEIENLSARAVEAQLPPKVMKAFEREMQRLRHVPSQSPDYGVQLTYLETLLDLPWNKATDDNLDIKHAEAQLNRDHYGMERVKERILEYLASLRYRDSKKAPILCLYGPPGVGKTSLGRSIAEALGRKYVRISLGGIHDEAEVRGHRRTYVGAMPGRIIKGMLKAESNNPLFVLDEVDKVSENNYNGDPLSALLEVLDPEQNNAFHDNYLDVDFDLSNVFFIATANSLQPIPRPLLDRMEVIEVEGYLTEEKKEIARRHLLPKLRKEYHFPQGLKLRVPAETVEKVIEHYTRESGVRQLEKQLEKIYRKVSYLTANAENGDTSLLEKPVSPSVLDTLLGKPLYNRDKYQGNRYAGVVTGLAWTAVGGEILFIETSLSRSKSAKLTLTGNLGDVMKESAALALEYIKAHASHLGIDYRVFDHWGIHVHVPEGATPKDGPSAGITIATSLASALTQRRVRDHVAMTGEITLRGRVLPVGGIKEKILAAKRAGITDIVISEENRKDVQDIPEKYLKGLTFHFVSDVHEVFDFALLPELVDDALTLDIPEEPALPVQPVQAAGTACIMSRC